MKRILFTLIGLLAIILFSAFFINHDKHIGLWKGIDQGEIGYLNLDESGFAILIINKDTIGGESCLIRGQEGFMKYNIDHSKEPETIDFILYFKEGNSEVDRLRGIFRFDDKDRMVLCVNFEGEERPSSFEDEGTIVLEKVNVEKK